jgi:hypothetical protein
MEETSMKIKSGYLLREVAGQFIVVPVGNQAISFNGIITLNKSGKVIWEVMQKETSVEEIVQALKKVFEVSDEVANKDVNTFLETLKKHSLVE